MNIFSEVEQRKTIFGEIVQNKSVRDLIYYSNTYFTQSSKYAMDNLCVVLYFNISAKDPKNKFIYFNSHQTYSPFSYDNIETKSINKLSKVNSSKNIFTSK